MIVWWWSRIVFFNEFEILVKRYSSTVISVNLLEIPFDHFFSNGKLERLECIFHKSSEFIDVNKLIFTLFLSTLGLLCSLSKEMSNLNKRYLTYSSKVIFPSPLSSILSKCQLSWSYEILSGATPRLSARRAFNSSLSRVELWSLS